MKTLARLMLVPALLAAAAGLVAASGLVDFSASNPPKWIEEKAVRFVLNRSIERHAPGKSNPLAGSRAETAAGLALYRAHCVGCHGAPGVDPTEEGASLNPPAPGLTLPQVQARSDGQLFWIVSHGIRMTGMPSFSPPRTEHEIWQLVTALRRLPDLSDAEQRAMGAER